MKKENKHEIIYITRDIERAIGCLSYPSIFIISNDSDFAKSIKKLYPERIFLIPNLNTLDTYELLEAEQTQQILNTFKKPKILVFKNTSKIEKWCDEHGYKLLNPPAKRAASIEEKITQLKTLENILERMPRYEVKTIEELGWFEKPFVLQFNHSHTGNGTIYIDSEKKLHELKEIFPKRECRIAPFIAGPICTSNIVVATDAIHAGNISYQITGLEPFTDIVFATIGNDWGVPYRILTESALTSYDLLVTEVAKTLQNIGWKGLFGIDAIWSTEEQKWYLIEINARQPASASYESELQQKIKKNDSTLTILEAHLKALLGESLTDCSLIRISDGAQIIQRVTKKIIWQQQTKEVFEKLVEKNLRVIIYNNAGHNSDLLRIQSLTSIMENEKQFSEVGEKIKNILEQI